MADLEPLGDDAENGVRKANLPAIVGAMTIVPAFIADKVIKDARAEKEKAEKH